MYAYKHWLKEVAKYYKISQADVIGSKREYTNAKSTYYFLLLRLGYDLYEVSIKLGKSRTTIATFINNSLNERSKSSRDREAEDYLLNKNK